MGEKLWLVRRVLYALAACIAFLFCVALILARAEQRPAQIEASSNRPAPTPRILPRPDQDEAYANHGAAGPQARSRDVEPSSVQGLSDERGDAQRRKEKYESEEKPTLDRGLTAYTGWLAVFTAALFFAAFGQVVLFWWQLRLIRDSLADGKKSADAAKTSADIADRSLRELQRALILPISFSTATVFQNGRALGCRITCLLENSGNTVARNFAGTANFVMWDGDLPEDFAYADRIKSADTKSVIGPKVKIPWPINVAMQDIIDIAEKKRSGYFYGWVEYEDIFTGSRKRRTEFCVALEVIGDPRLPHDKASPIECGAVGPYNAVDEDCRYKPGKRPPIGGLPEPTKAPPEPSLQL